MIRFFFVTLILGASVGTAAEAVSLRQDAYVWQRSWTDSVTNAVRTLAPHFGELIVLQAEVSWENGTPTCTRVELDYPTLRSTDKPVGLALRIGPFSGPFTEDEPRTAYLATLSKTLVAEAVANQLEPLEIQLDFDCAESKLDGYRIWVTAIQAAVHPLPVTVTALPSWLNQPAFRNLVGVADGYVLQVHSLERPRSPEVLLTLCDPQAAKRAVARASAIGRPFRVALPTYGYRVAFDEQGTFLGLSAEGPTRRWPTTAQVVEIRADPIPLSGLVREWSANRPPELMGLIWYRLPVSSDVMNWQWPTLETVMAGEEPASEVRAHVRRVKPGLVEIDLANEGTADAQSKPCATLYWEKHRRIAADGLEGYQVVESGPTALRLQPTHFGRRLRAGERMVIGWVRFDGDPEVKVEIDELPH